jgi:hypothetical protein
MRILAALATACTLIAPARAVPAERPIISRYY